jgi:amino acid transporter
VPALSTTPAPRSVSTELARDRLGPFTVGTTIASSVAPLTVVALLVPVALATTGLLAVPIALAAVAVVLLLFSNGYLAMTRHIENAGAFYAYVAQALGRPLGVGTAWVALLVYNFFQLCCYGAITFASAPLLERWFHIDLHWMILAVVAWLIVSFLGANEVGISGKVLVALVLAETVLVVLQAVAIVFTSGFTLNTSALAPNALWGPGAGTLIVIGMTAFAGIEQSAVYIEESKDPRRTVRVATYGTIAVIASVYFFASWVQISAAGAQVIDRATNEGADLFFNEATVALGNAAWYVGHILLTTGSLAAAIAFHNAVSRYTFSLGREGVLPKRFGRTTLTGAPRNASFAQSALAIVVLIVFWLKDLKPVDQLFYWGSTSGGFGILLLITITSAAVIVFFARGHRGENAWRRVFAPGIATALLLWLSWLAYQNLPTLFGPTAAGPARLLPIIVLAVFAAGIVWGLILRAAKPEIYAGIGRGTQARLATATF